MIQYVTNLCVAASSSRFGVERIREACRDGNLDSIRQLAEAVEGAVRDRDRRMRAEKERIRAEEVQKREVTGISAFRLQGEIVDSEVGHFVYRLVRACGDHGHPPPPELTRLVQTYTKQDRPPRGTGRRAGAASGWREKAADYWQKNPDARQADLARVAGVNRSTISKAIKIGRLRSPIKLLPVKE